MRKTPSIRQGNRIRSCVNCPALVCPALPRPPHPLILGVVPATASLTFPHSKPGPGPMTGDATSMTSSSHSSLRQKFTQQGTLSHPTDG
ncbi:hypothetical protein DM02DRAFT_1350 [Periconia macrospinosa]|uniref:Uncharacterized protein n=1 Tax=Periconia macrospinosa TaxID=97972 RepID=A0A2V1ECT2_9PLEO|nr:hypothetical protein DM02DRAFT_1350 [Periconia macrospinosa]